MIRIQALSQTKDCPFFFASSVFVCICFPPHKGQNRGTREKSGFVFLEAKPAETMNLATH